MSPAFAEITQLAPPSAAIVAAVDAYNRGDIASAYRGLKAEADRGDSDAQVNLGYLYARGQGMAADQGEALRLYGLSAAQGNGEGMNALGYKYQFGTGVAPDIHIAVRWYCAAIAHGNPRAMNNLALILNEGRYVKRDVAQARDLWTQALERGHINGMLNLGVSLLQEPDLATRQEGMRWIMEAAARGQAGAEDIARRAGYRGALPPIVDYTGRMELQPRDATPGHAGICGDLIS